MDPDLREITDATCDFGSPLKQLLDEYRHLMPNLDSSLLESLLKENEQCHEDLWCLMNSIDTSEHDLRVLDHVQREWSEKGRELLSVVVELLDQKKFIECQSNVDLRIQRVKGQIKRQVQKLEEAGETEGQIAVVGSSEFF
eukprot:CAMPEP_0168610594 /NCGR_PEP_ID=MMETSP0449_2-20121227/1874_1 /TAXON_ID=1082188 /ORGANISM="Strombidium rassoulzadegani, Strain ras09" /LENGTH=140 /DNA_ID=CAMNT_0008650917 /DNA_START=178 /DNA_END=600 /DNA_ORIENTATION=+